MHCIGGSHALKRRAVCSIWSVYTIEIETDILEEETEVILPKVEAVDKKQESEEESEPIIEEQEDEEQPTFQFNLSVNTQMDMKQKEGDKKREEAEKK